MKYDQFYYSWAPSGISQYNKKGGYGIAASSNGNGDFLRKCESIALNKKPELTGMNTITEYFQYVESLKTYVFAGIYQIEAPEEMRGRDNSLAHVFVPAEPVNMQNPSSYIRRMEYTSIQRLEAGKDTLSLQEIPESGFDYHQLLRKYNLTDCSRLAVLLSMEFEGYFADGRRAIVFPLESSEPEKFSETAREITWLLHSWVPDCLRKSADELRQKLGYVVAGSTSNKNCLCFIPENGEIENNKQRFELRYSYDCNDKKNIARGADFYYELAKKAQESPQAVVGLIGEICGLLPEVKSINRILDAFECYQLQHMKAGDVLPDWEAVSMKKKLDRAKKNDVLAKEYCIDYLIRANQFSHSFSLDSRQLKECWDALAYDSSEKSGGSKKRAKLEKRFRPLVPVFLDMSFQSCSKSKSGDWKPYLEKLALLEDTDSEMWIENLYQREGGCIHEHLAGITSENGVEVLAECVRYYGIPLGKDQQFRREIFTYAQELYSKNRNNSAIRRTVDQCIRENGNVFDLKKWDELVIDSLPGDSLEFCEKYKELNAKSLQKRWLNKASESLEEIFRELAQGYLNIPSKRSKGFQEFQDQLTHQCRSWLRLAVVYRMAVNGNQVVDWNWIYEKLNEESLQKSSGQKDGGRKNSSQKNLRQGNFYSSFMESLVRSAWREDEKDMCDLANQLDIYGSLRSYLANRMGQINDADCINDMDRISDIDCMGDTDYIDDGCISVSQLEKYAQGYRKHVLEEDRQKELEKLLAGDAMKLYEKQSASEKKRICRCMGDIPSWEKEVDRKFNCQTLEEFLKLSPDLEEDYPDKWDREHAKFAPLLANYDAILKRRNEMDFTTKRKTADNSAQDAGSKGSRFQNSKGSFQKEADEFRSRTGTYQNEADKFQSRTGTYQSEADEFRSRTGTYQSEADEFQSRTGTYQSEGGISQEGFWKSQNGITRSQSRIGKKQAEYSKRNKKDDGNQTILDFLNK